MKAIDETSWERRSRGFDKLMYYPAALEVTDPKKKLKLLEQHDP
jgi:hypothetical protein